CIRDLTVTGVQTCALPICVRDRLLEALARPRVLPLGREGVRGDGLDAERAEDEREHERRRRVAVVDDELEPALADRLDVEAREQIGRASLRDRRKRIVSAT